MTTLDNDSLIAGGRVNLTPELSAKFGIPSGLEFWRFNLVRGALDPAAYSMALRSMTNAALHILLTMFDQIETVARRNPGIIVPIEHDADLHNILDDLRSRVRAEASRRSVTLAPWSETRN